MPLYIVRSPQLRISIISAADEDDLRFRLVEVADPATLVWQEYEGALWVDFEPPVRFADTPRDDHRSMASDEFELEGVQDLADAGWTLRARPGDCEPGSRMVKELTEYAFPVVSELEPVDETTALDAHELEDAIEEDLVRHAWVLAQKLKKELPAGPASLETLQAMWRVLGINQPSGEAEPGEQGRKGKQAEQGKQAEKAKQGGRQMRERAGAVLQPELADSTCVAPAWFMRCHWCGRRELIDGEWPRSPAGWIQRQAGHEGSYLFCSLRCELDAEERCSSLRVSDCSHDNVGNGIRLEPEPPESV